MSRKKGSQKNNGYSFTIALQECSELACGGSDYHRYQQQPLYNRMTASAVSWLADSDDPKETAPGRVLLWNLFLTFAA